MEQRNPLFLTLHGSHFSVLFRLCSKKWKMLSITALLGVTNTLRASVPTFQQSQIMVNQHGDRLVMLVLTLGIFRFHECWKIWQFAIDTVKDMNTFKLSSVQCSLI